MTLPRAAACGLAALLALAPAAAAQAPPQPAGDLTLSWSFLQDKQLDERLNQGAVLSLAFNPGRSYGLVAEVSGHRKDLSVPEAPDGSLRYEVGSLLGGLRFWGRGRTRLYLQLLAGYARTRLEVLALPAGGAEPAGPVTSLEETHFALQPGAGLDMKVSERIALRVGGDYRIIHSDPQTKQWRGHVGLSFYFGQR